MVTVTCAYVITGNGVCSVSTFGSHLLRNVLEQGASLPSLELPRFAAHFWKRANLKISLKRKKYYII